MSRCSVRRLALRSSRSRLNQRVGRHAHIFWWVFEHSSVRRRLFLCMATSFPAQRKKPRVRRPHGGSAIIQGVLGAHLPALRRACGATAAQCSGDAATAARASVFLFLRALCFFLGFSPASSCFCHGLRGGASRCDVDAFPGYT